MTETNTKAAPSGGLGRGEGARVTWIGAGVNAALVALKLTVGLLGRSQALVADAIHSMSDFFSDAVVLTGLWIGGKDADPKHPWGHGRFETLAAAVVGLALMGAAVGMGYDAVGCIMAGRASPPAWPVLAAAAVSIGAKEWLYRFTKAVGLRIGSPAVAANAWHHRTDALSSVAVLVGAAAALVDPRLAVLDSWAALVVAAMVLWAGGEILWEAAQEMADTSPAPEVLERIDACARGVTGVLGTHDLKARSSAGRLIMQLHIEVNGGMSVTEGHRIAKEVEGCLLREMSEVEAVLVHVDPVTPGRDQDERKERDE